METKLYIFIGPNGEEVPIVAPVNIEFPSMLLTGYGSYCGAGDGFGDIIVPETIWGIIVTVACYVHDHMWNIAGASWSAFHLSNAIFLRNLISIITHCSKYGFLKRLRLYRCVTYFNAVDSFGPDVFWKLKNDQKEEARTLFQGRPV